MGMRIPDQFLGAFFLATCCANRFDCDGDPTAIDDDTRAEAGLLVAEWQDALNMPRATFDDEESRIAQ